MRVRLRPLLPFAALALACAHEAAVRAPEERGAPAPAPRAAATAPAPAATVAPPRSPGRERPADRAAATPAPAAQAGSTARATAPPPPVRLEPGPGDFYPLAVGNEWRYVDQSPSLRPELRGALRTVRILERTKDGYYLDTGRGELRVEGDCLRDHQRRMLCQPFQPGASWTSVVSVSSTERYEIAAVHETVETPAGRFEDCVRVRAHNRASAGTDHVLEITYAPRVGVVRIETFVVVDGKITPQVKALLQSYHLEGR